MSLERTVKWIDKTGPYPANMRDARKLFRLFKSVNEYKKIQDLLSSKDPFSFNNIMNIIVRGAFLIYWFFDNLSILAKIKIIDRDPKPFGKYGATFWFIALLANLILVIKQIITNRKTIEQLQRSYLSSPNEKQIQEKRTQFVAAQKKMHGYVLNIIKLVGDMVPAGQGSQIIPKVLGVNASDGLCGLGGLASALISSYQLYD